MLFKISDGLLCGLNPIQVFLFLAEQMLHGTKQLVDGAVVIADHHKDQYAGQGKGDNDDEDRLVSQFPCRFQNQVGGGDAVKGEIPSFQIFNI